MAVLCRSCSLQRRCGSGPVDINLGSDRDEARQKGRLEGDTGVFRWKSRVQVIYIFDQISWHAWHYYVGVAKQHCGIYPYMGIMQSHSQS